MSRGLLSREELEALLESAAEGQLREEQARRSSRPFAGEGGERPRPARLAPLLRILDEFGEEQGRTLSTQYQVAISFNPVGWEEVTPREFSSSLLDTDRIAVLDLSPGGQRALLLVNRGLLFGWLCLAFGARQAASGGALPQRAYTRIEERFLRRVAGELARQLARSWSPRHGLTATLRSIEEPERIVEGDPGPLLSVSYEVKGMGELCRLRVLLPPEAFDAADRSEPAAAGATPRAALEAPLLDMPVAVRVEAGTAELSLAEIVALQPGDVIPLRRADALGLLVRVEDAPKFRAERGAVGGRLAARITERL